jgi:hypothetical protein
MRRGDTPSPSDAGEVADGPGGPRRTILIHGWAPPTRGGTAFAVGRVLLNLDRSTLDVWTRASQSRAVRRGGFVLPGRYRYFPKLRSLPRGPRCASQLLTTANVGLAVISGLIIGALARRASARCIVAVVDEAFSQIAGAVSARCSGLPLVIWAFDPWEENAYATSDRAVARWLEARIWRSAAIVVVHSEELAEHYRAKHGVRCHILRIPIDVGNRPAGARLSEPSQTEPGGWEVLVAGSVYWAQVEALQRVASAVRLVDGAFLTVIGDPKLQPEAIDADRYETAASGDAFQTRLRQAQLLVLGLSFDTDHPVVVETATPARLPEYLASGVPVLVHAPPDSHVAQYARRWDLATVVDEPSVDTVAAAIQTIKDDPSASAQRAGRARSYTLAQHDASVVRAAFMALLDGLADRERLS